ncbi:unnamed protein product [Microthlaspi erraticum]|uniref:Uncharacterized protein n=1 Tax=Microthlaspi erraticum TaxID=1685480 RepID=A0A6D2KC42_9BRAS|nr:unnamed protein product [Microthlaspi erraticum]
MRIEGEKGVKTQSAPKHWPRTRKRDFGRAIPIWPTVRSSREGISRARPDFYLRDRNRSRHARTGKERSRSAEILYRNGPTVPVDPGNTLGLGRNSLAKTNLADQIARPRQNPSAIGPKLF